MNELPIRPLRAEEISAVARLHAAELRYSFNSRLGARHLESIYRAMLAAPDTFIAVAWDDQIPTGVVSGTLNTRQLKTAILDSLGLTGKLLMVAKLLVHPSAVPALLEETKSRPPVKVGGREVNASLTTIAVASSHRRLGLAARLVAALESFFRRQGTSHYWLETIVENDGARKFYHKQGFGEFATHGRTVVFLKTLSRSPT